MVDATLDTKSGPSRQVRYGSVKRGRKRALYWSYFFLVLFAVFFLVPPLYMLVTSL
jgi:multiple sugar transport system permease protein